MAEERDGRNRTLTPQAERALAEARARRREIDARQAAMAPEKGGRGGLDGHVDPWTSPFNSVEMRDDRFCVVGGTATTRHVASGGATFPFTNNPTMPCDPSSSGGRPVSTTPNTTSSLMV